MTASESSRYETIMLERVGRIARLTLNRPAKLNALNRVMLRELPLALDEIAADPGIRVTILVGAGRCFSAGFDVAKPASAPADYGAHVSPIEERVDLRSRMNSLLSVWDHPKPVVAQVHGFCMAAASLLAGFADLTIVAEDAQIGLPQLPLGGGFLSPGWVHLVGPKRAKQLSFVAGERITGSVAASWGWANYAVAADELDGHVAELATRIAKTPRDVLELKKASVNRMVDSTGWRATLLSGAETDALAHQSDGVRAIQQLIRADGLKAAIAAFAAGEIDF